MRVSEKKHWDDFWNVSGEAAEVYDNEGRVSRHYMDVRPLEGLKVLEVGAGTGRDGIFMATQGASVVSLDYSMPSLGMVRSSVPEGADVSLVCGDAFSLPFPDGTFDLVFHQGLLEHFRNPEDMLSEHHRVLRKGGHILVDVPQRWHYYTALKHLMIAAGKWFAGWETEFSPRELEKMRHLEVRKVKQAGFQVLKLEGVPAVLVEIGFFSNRDEARRLADPRYAEEVGERLADAVVSFVRHHLRARPSSVAALAQRGRS